MPIKTSIEELQLETIPKYEVESRINNIKNLTDANRVLKKQLSSMEKCGNTVSNKHYGLPQEINNKKMRHNPEQVKSNLEYNIVFRVTYSNVNIYSKANLRSEVLIKVSRNSRVTLIDQGADNSWSKIMTTNGIIGWVESKRIKLN